MLDSSTCASPTLPLSVGELIDAYLADRALDLRAGKIEPKYLACLSHYLRVFRRDYGSTPVASIPRRVLRLWLRNHPEWKSGYTCDDACGAVVSAFRWAADEEAWKDVAVPTLKRPQDLIPGKPVRRPLSKDEYRAIINESRKDGRPSTRRAFRFAMRFLWRTGARTCEMRTAEIAKLDLASGVLKVRHKTQKKTGGLRTIPLDAFLTRLVRVLLSRRRWGQTTVFVNGRGRPWTCQAFADLFRLLADRAGVPRDVSAYSARHGYLCRARAKGVPTDDVADITGNSPQTIRRHYDAWQRTQSDHLQRIMASVNGVNGNGKHG